MNLTQIVRPVALEMDSVNQVMTALKASDVALLNQVIHHITCKPGKQLRPLTLLLVSKSLNYSGAYHIDLAAVLEFVHTATLLHDDVVDVSALRRGQATANHLWGNPASVLTGDFLYSRAFQMMVKTESLSMMRIMADATNIIAEGEIRQLMNKHNPDVTEQDYMSIIRAKTGKLFEVAAHLGAVLSDAPVPVADAMQAFGMHLGTAFQLIDDALDYESQVENIGKNLGDDLAGGTPTLPLIHALHNTTGEQQALIKKAIKTGGLEHLDAIQTAISDTKGIAYTTQVAQQEADKALAHLAQLPDNAYKKSLIDLVHFAVKREH